MKNVLHLAAAAMVWLQTLSLLAAEYPKPVRMGCGIMTFDTAPGWGLRPDGASALGPTHGAVVIDKAGNVFVSANKGVVVFSPGGKVIQEYLGDNYAACHDMEIRQEGLPSSFTQPATPKPRGSSSMPIRAKSCSSCRFRKNPG